MVNIETIQRFWKSSWKFAGVAKNLNELVKVLNLS